VPMTTAASRSWCANARDTGSARRAQPWLLAGRNSVEIAPFGALRYRAVTSLVTAFRSAIDNPCPLPYRSRQKDQGWQVRGPLAAEATNLRCVLVHWSGVRGVCSALTVSSLAAARRDLRRPPRDPSKCLVETKENEVAVGDVVPVPAAGVRGDPRGGEPGSSAADDQGFAQRMMDAEAEQLCGLRGG
jgi:hypothetical protein